MNGNSRNTLENSNVDFLIFEHRKIFEINDDNYTFFAYNFYFFYLTQKQNRTTGNKFRDEDETKFKQLFQSKVNNKRQSQKLHVTHDNYWSLNEGRIVERTIEKFKLNYQDRHFFGLKRLSTDSNETIQMLKIKQSVGIYLQILKTLILIIGWATRFFPNFLSLNRKMTKEFLPPFPIFRFIVQLCRLKILEIVANQYLKRSFYREIYFSNYYSLKSMAICSAARKLGLKTINLQHGIQGARHPAFNFRAFKSVKLPNYVPVRFYCYYLDKRHNLCHPQFEVILNNFEQKSTARNKCRKILVTMQPSFSFNKYFFDMFDNLANRGVQINFKLHPRSNPQNNLIRKFCQKKNLSILPSNINIREALKGIDAHVKGFSSSALDAAELGVKTYFIDERAVELYDSLIANAAAEFYISSEELLQNLMLYD